MDISQDVHNFETINPELKPCPFCGDKPVWYLDGDLSIGKRTLVIHCRNCGARMVQRTVTQHTGYLEALSVSRWNTRVVEHKNNDKK